MKSRILVITLVVTVYFVSCSPLTPSTQTIPSNTVSTPTSLATTSSQSSTSHSAEESQIRDLVDKFGKRLQTVSLLAPDAAQEIKDQYSEFVSPKLLETWMNDVSTAPGRMVSSPWPDRIEITTLSKQNSDRYEITGYVIEVTSLEIVNGEAAAKIPVHMVAQKDQGRWQIVEYTEER